MIRTMHKLASATAFLMIATSAQAAPPVPITGTLATSDLRAIAWRCWWQDGVRLCGDVPSQSYYRPDYGPYVYGYRAYRAPGYRNPDRYRTGSRRWWDEMDRQDRGGRR